MGTSFYLTKIIEAFIISIGLAFFASPLSIKLAKKIGVIDTPKDARRVHKNPIPRFGGMAIFIGSMAAMLIPAGMNQNIKAVMVGGALAGVVGMFFVIPVVSVVYMMLRDEVQRRNAQKDVPAENDAE